MKAKKHKWLLFLLLSKAVYTLWANLKLLEWLEWQNDTGKTLIH